jgi:hypothetical protein
MNPDEVLSILQAGNERYLNGTTHKHDFHADSESLERYLSYRGIRVV